MKKSFIFLLIILTFLILIYLFKEKEIISNLEYKEDNINIEYPYFNNKKIDIYINDYLNETINNFKYKENQELFIDYDYYIDNSKVSLTFYNYEVKNNITTQEIKKININIETEEINLNTSKNTKEKYYDIYSNKVLDKNTPLIALTFDDGPNHNTNKIIDILNKYNVKATFFILGTNIKGNEEIIKKLKTNNMEIGNHGYSHKLLTRLKQEKIASEFTKTNQLIYDITGYYPTLTRPSYGSTSKKIRNSITTPIITWNIDPLDWKYHNSKRIANNILKKVKDGDIILMHDIYSATANALDIVIPTLLEKGYKLVTVSEMFYYKDQTLIEQNVYSKAP